ncbi:GDP-mannose 4,6-dehydratase [Litorivicinus sp.]|nr:GDP-mannose 4,6-dehydratase [Litorivicinus sp.]
MKIIVTGVSGQDGALLARDLLVAGHEVHGFVRRGSLPKTPRTDFLGITKKIIWHQVELTEFSNVFSTISRIQPQQIFNLAAQSFVADSFLFPHLTHRINFEGYLNILESVKLLGCDCSIYQASTSEMFGTTEQSVLSEETPFAPKSPYAVSKVASHYIGQNYREAYGMKISNGILFNHESELRGREFVTRKVTLQLNEIAIGEREVLCLGNLNSVRDWGYAGDFVEAMQLIMNSGESDDYIVATNKVHTIRDLVQIAGTHLGLDIKFEGVGLNEIGIDAKTNRVIVKVDERYFRPSDVTYLQGDFKKINTALGWYPKTSFREMIEKMVKTDKQRVGNQIHVF